MYTYNVVDHFRRNIYILVEFNILVYNIFIIFVGSLNQMKPKAKDEVDTLV